jgi:negative regulator of flagellin synthesis FlgM
MKIDSSSLTIAFSGTSSAPVRTGTDEKNASTPAPTTSGSSTVSISDASSKIQELESSGVLHASGFDAARVAAIKQAIRDGKFQVNSQMIAEKLLLSARSLIQQQVS